MNEILTLCDMSDLCDVISERLQELRGQDGDAVRQVTIDSAVRDITACQGHIMDYWDLLGEEEGQDGC